MTDEYKIFLGVFSIAIILFFIIKISMKDGFSNYTTENSSGIYPDAETKVLVEDTFPRKGSTISNNTSADIWQEYPVYQLGSYEQITNNIRYPDLPDEGTCTPASMCGALYDKINSKNNPITPLPPISPDCGTRVGYFSADDNLLTFKTNLQNILY